MNIFNLFKEKSRDPFVEMAEAEEREKTICDVKGHNWSMQRDESDSRYWFNSEIPFPNCRVCGKWMPGRIIYRQNWEKFLRSFESMKLEVKTDFNSMTISDIQKTIDQYNEWEKYNHITKPKQAFTDVNDLSKEQIEEFKSYKDGGIISV